MMGYPEYLFRMYRIDMSEPNWSNSGLVRIGKNVWLATSSNFCGLLWDAAGELVSIKDVRVRVRVRARIRS